MGYTKEHCGCTCSINQVADTYEVKIIFCPLHKAAPKLYEACRLALFPLKDYNKMLKYVKLDEIILKLEQAIAGVEGK